MTDQRSQPPGHDYRVPVPPGVKAALNAIGELIGSGLPEGWGFTLLIFEYGGDKTMTYISSAKRADMVTTMSEFIGKQGS